MSSSEYTYFGLNNTYNAKMAYSKYSQFLPDDTNPSLLYMTEMAA
jgi:hypothetical protein